MTGNDILVSVICNAYNHEKYIAEALEGFVMQKTSFQYEVLVHDDASTDNTAQIIREYEKKYPNLIKPIYQSVNQYSQSISITNTYQCPRAKGRYIAFCEGDDYWTDPCKLQKQVDALENNPQIDVCAHLANIRRGEKIIGTLGPGNKTKIFTVAQVIEGGGGFVATNSLLFRKEAFLKDYAFARVINLDYVWQIKTSLRGGMLYLADNMSVYRRMSAGSWTERMRKDPEKFRRITQKVEQMLRCLDEETSGVYHESIDFYIKQTQIETLYAQGNCKEIFQRDYMRVLRRLPLKFKVRVYVGRICPKLLIWRRNRKQHG